MKTDNANHAVLVINDIHAQYAKKKILQGVSLYCKKNEIVGVVGPYGAGKSTLFKVIAGALVSTTGEVIFYGQNVTYLPQHTRTRKGMAYSNERSRIFPQLSVSENLRIIANIYKKGADSRVVELLDLFPNLKEVLSSRAENLNDVQRQMLAICMSLINPHPNLLLLLDAPCAGLSSKFADLILDKILELREKLRISIVIAESKVRKLLKVTDRVYLLKNGVIEKKDWFSELEIDKLEEAFFPMI